MFFNGLDDNGFILNECSLDNIQPEFKAVVNGVINTLLITFVGDIHSVYLYGSIARGNAVLAKSDLDLSVIFNRPLAPNDYEIIQSLSIAMKNAYPEVSKVDIDPSDIDTILRKEEHYHWHFWLKHCCCCVWGKDVAVNFAKHHPSTRIACAINGDISSFLADMEPRFTTMQQKEINKIIGKKLLRTAYYLIAEQDNSWHSDLSLCYSSAISYYPDNQHDLQIAYELAQGIYAGNEDGKSLYHSFGKLLQLTIEREKHNHAKTKDKT